MFVVSNLPASSHALTTEPVSPATSAHHIIPFHASINRPPIELSKSIQTFSNNFQRTDISASQVRTKFLSSFFDLVIASLNSSSLALNVIAQVRSQSFSDRAICCRTIFNS